MIYEVAALITYSAFTKITLVFLHFNPTVGCNT